MAKHEEFRITQGKGFHITFENGYTVSVQFGWGNYCEKRDMADLSFLKGGTDAVRERDRKHGVDGCANAETAVWGPDGDMIRRGDNGDEVQGWQTPADVLRLLNWAAEQDPSAQEEKES